MHEPHLSLTQQMSRHAKKDMWLREMTRSIQRIEIVLFIHLDVSACEDVQIIWY